MAALYGTGNFGEGTWPDPAASGTIVAAAAASSIAFQARTTAQGVRLAGAASSITFDVASSANMISTGLANVTISFDAWADATDVITWAAYHPCEPGVWIPWRRAA